MVFAEPAGRAVVVDHAVFAQHQAVARLADGQLGEGVAIDAVEEFGGVLAEDLDLAERRDIADAGILADVQHFAIDAFAPGRFARAREPGRAIPEAGLDKDGAVLLGPVVQRRFAHRLEVLAARSAGQRAEGDRRIERAEGRGADLGRRDAARFGKDADGVDVGQLALIGRHAVGGVALGELDMAVAFAHGEAEVLQMDVVLVVDEGLALRCLDMTRAAWRRLQRSSSAP